MARNEPSEARTITIDQLRAIHGANPFRPYVIHMADGRKLPVPSPDVVLIPPQGQTVVVWRPDGTFKLVDMLRVTDLEFRLPNFGRRRSQK